mgnify:CR=1 FL=1
MSDVIVFGRLGFGHIADWQGYDHMLFLLALCGGYTLKQWRSLLILVTAFTIGHSFSLALATLNLVAFSAQWVELLIPVTIALTSISNLRPGSFSHGPRFGFRYAMAGIFGLIHGLGFSSYLQELLGGGSSILLPLLGFNIGLEIGQLMIVGLIVLLGWAAIVVGRFPQREWNVFLSGGATALAFLLISQNIFW